MTADTLIPRPETELLVEKILAVTADGPLDILELGVGSGAILISLLLKRKEAQGLGVDISEGAVAVARKNAKNLGVTDRSEIIVSDLFEKVPEGRKFDLIVSNPPYIPKKDLAGLSPEVRKEPLGALDGGEDGLIFTVASCGKAWLILRKMACLLLKWALVKARLLQTFLFKTAAARPASFLTMRGLTAWS